MWLLIDDIRDLKCDVIARTPASARKMLAVGGWECICFDHDLGCEESGYDIMKEALSNNFLQDIPQIQLVTSNPVGRENMANLLLSNKFTTKDNVNFFNGEQNG